VREYKSYKGRNPKIGTSVDVQPKKLPFFKVGKELKEMIDSKKYDQRCFMPVFL
jgi:integration host factor subunit beta